MKIESCEQLNELPDKTVIVNYLGEVWQNGFAVAGWRRVGDKRTYSSLDIPTPAHVLCMETEGIKGRLEDLWRARLVRDLDSRRQ